MRRLYLHIYLALVGALVLLTILIGVVLWTVDHERDSDRWLVELTRFAERILPPPDAPLAETERVLRAFADPLELDARLFDAAGDELLRFGSPEIDRPERQGSRFLPRRGRHAVLVLDLADGRTLVIDGHRDADPRPLRPLLGVIALFGLALAVAAYPVARRLTRRLETLKQHVDRFGEGRLDVRAPVQGRDEVAELARSFNASADRIERLVEHKSRLLADTSHELRTPLTRVRMALELLRSGPRPELLDDVDRDVEELDDLIGELLMASRLDAIEARLERETVDLLALAAEEAAGRDAIVVRGEAVQTVGDARLLRRMLRNLIENALRHGDPPVEVTIARDQAGPGAVIRVEDAGPGVDPTERERIFDPFYRPTGESNAPGGVGLGLSLVRRIAEGHGGQVRCEDSRHGGSAFVVVLPG